MTTKLEDSERFPAAPGDPPELAGLLDRMQGGDRGAAAQLVTRYGSRIRRRIRGKLSASMRRVYDSQDILATLGRRLDLFVLRGRLQAASTGQLWNLVVRMAERALLDKARTLRRARELEQRDSPLARRLAARMQREERTDPEGAVIRRAFELIDDPRDRAILHHWLRGADSAAIARQVGLTRVAVWKRWERIRCTLQRRLAQEAGA